MRRRRILEEEAVVGEDRGAAEVAAVVVQSEWRRVSAEHSVRPQKRINDIWNSR